jgi:hypothetical protein
MQRNRHTGKATSEKGTPASIDIDIPEEEQWRIINDSGVLHHVSPTEDEVESTSLADEIFNAVLYVIPFSSVLLMMEMYVVLIYAKINDKTNRSSDCIV